MEPMRLLLLDDHILFRESLCRLLGAEQGFEIAGPDRRFYFARALILGNQIEVSSDLVANPVAVRYGWSNTPVDINLCNADGFPASPFRTDNWPGITDKEKFYK